ncbi:hypothetical protein D3C87_758530 [compost metagenome]
MAKTVLFAVGILEVFIIKSIEELPTTTICGFALLSFIGDLDNIKSQMESLIAISFEAKVIN